jgi:hypothetical protein
MITGAVQGPFQPLSDLLATENNASDSQLESFMGWNDLSSVVFTGVGGPTNGYSFGLDDINVTLSGGNPVPAPATLALFGLGLAGLGWSRRKKA